MNVKDDVLRRLDALLQKADAVLATHKPNPPNVSGFPTLESQAFTEWQTGLDYQKEKVNLSR